MTVAVEDLQGKFRHSQYCKNRFVLSQAVLLKCPGSWKTLFGALQRHPFAAEQNASPAGKHCSMKSTREHIYRDPGDKNRPASLKVPKLHGSCAKSYRGGGRYSMRQPPTNVGPYAACFLDQHC